jgi:hypothetical protein
MNRSGLFTTEFWITIVTQGLALLTLLGVVTSNDADTLRDAVIKCVTSAGVFVANAWIVVRYIQSRTQLKSPK